MKAFKKDFMYFLEVLKNILLISLFIIVLAQYPYHVIVMVMGVFAHELAHYIMFERLGYKKPDVKISWMKIEVSHKLASLMRPIEMLYVLLVGVLCGLPFVVFNKVMLIAYLFFSSSDIFNIFTLRSMNQKKTILESNVKSVNDDIKMIKKELNIYD